MAKESNYKGLFLVVLVLAIVTALAYFLSVLNFGEAVTIKNTGTCVFTCFITGVNNDASFTVAPGVTKSVSLPNVGGIYKGACYDPAVYVNGQTSTYQAIDTSKNFGYTFSITTQNCQGTTTTTLGGNTCAGYGYYTTQQSGKVCTPKNMGLIGQCWDCKSSCESYGYYTTPQSGGKTCITKYMGSSGSTADQCYDCYTTECTGGTKFTYHCATPTQNIRDFYTCTNGKWVKSTSPDVINCQNGLVCVNGVDGCEGTTTLPTSPTTPPTSQPLSCTSLGLYPTSQQGLICNPVYSDVLSRYCFACSGGGVTTTTTTLAPCHTAWTYNANTNVCDEVSSCAGNYYLLISYDTLSECNKNVSLPPKPVIDPMFIVEILGGGLLTVALLMYLTKKK
jgi:hypothetical protein